MPSNTLTVLLDEPIAVIRPELYGHFAEHLGGCVYGGLWVGEDSKIPNDGGIRLDVLRALQRLSIPVIRWPGGCFADDYHWEDGIGPPADRPRRFNAWWGHNVEDNSFGTHEFLRLCQLLNAKPYLAGNVGSCTPREMKQWVEYCNFNGDTTLTRRRKANGHAEPFDIAYWGIGNESWGCGGSMCPEDYASLYKRFATFVSTFTRPPTKMPLYLVACGPNGNNLDWTRRFFQKAGIPNGDWQLHGYAAHYYAGTAGTATEYSTDQWYELLHRGTQIEKLILDQRAALDEIDPHRKIGLILDEWGTWHPPTPDKQANHLFQQNTLRDALLAAMTLNTFNRHADKVVMANIAQVVNVLQAMVLTDGDRMLCTPTYHVFDLFQSHQGGMSLKVEVSSREIRFPVGDESATLPAISASASVKNGQLTLSIINAHAAFPVDLEVKLNGRVARDMNVYTLAHSDLTAHNSFESPDFLIPTLSVIQPKSATWIQTVPAASITVLRGPI